VGSDFPIIRDRSTFSYLKRDKIQDFDQRLAGGATPDLRGKRIGKKIICIALDNT